VADASPAAGSSLRAGRRGAKVVPATAERGHRPGAAWFVSQRNAGGDDPFGEPMKARPRFAQTWVLAVHAGRRLWLPAASLCPCFMPRGVGFFGRSCGFGPSVVRAARTGDQGEHHPAVDSVLHAGHLTPVRHRAGRSRSESRSAVRRSRRRAMDGDVSSRVHTPRENRSGTEPADANTPPRHETRA